MNDIESILNNMNQKKEQILKFEELSELLLSSDIDEMEEIVDKREVIIQTVNMLEEEMLQMPFYQEHSEEIRNAIKNRANRDDINIEYLPLFDKGQELFAIVNRISRMEEAIAQHIEDCRIKLEERIKESNALPKIKRYLDSIPNEIEDGSLLSSGSKKV